MSTGALFLTAAAVLSGLSRGDSVSQTPALIAVNVGDSVQLFCNYTKTSNNVYLFWYRQHSSGPMELLLRRNKFDGEAEKFHGDRLSSELDHVNRTIKLKVVITELADSAVYYCALSPTESQDWSDPVQKLVRESLIMTVCQANVQIRSGSEWVPEFTVVSDISHLSTNLYSLQAHYSTKLNL
ncbi:hypothetical protein chiPu_0026427 [Chiloscyllium punctatum]|uniref:Ig-like domain-containing protein n=1 Tax=Chiloscyllium punctatum TaxID=137246 RepID=A0A401THF3_CHIPU|nr:hypothetical protein [Chiloscyllium punctatum]